MLDVAANLVELGLKQTYDTSADNVINDFFLPLLKSADSYDRGVGFFSAGWLRCAAEGMADFATRGGVARWITSPILSESDIDAIVNCDDVVAKIDVEILRNVQALKTELEQNTLNALAWMVYDKIVEFRFALPRCKLSGGDFHDKFGIFYVDNSCVSFNGSYNDSIHGNLNFESFKVFRGWISGELSFVKADVNKFERLWQGKDPNVQVFSASQAVVSEIFSLRTSGRPYKKSDQSVDGSGELPLRGYQSEAVAAWVKAEYRGVFEMATGTGKTYTALRALKELEINVSPLVIIACPYIHLVDQWCRELSKLKIVAHKVYGASSVWFDSLHRDVFLLKKGLKKSVYVVVSNATFRMPKFRQAIDRCKDVVCIVSDEMHTLGARSFWSCLSEEWPYRLGLSATPERYFDDEGSAFLMCYFGGVIYEYGLEKAIGEFLTPYKYLPYLVEMTDHEFFEYHEISKSISMHIDHDTGMLKTDTGKMLAIKRSKIQNDSQNKIAWLAGVVGDVQHVEYSLFYSGSGLFSQVLELLGCNLNLKVHEFTHRQSADERNAILEEFASGSLQGLVAMRCLDEGVDVPPTRAAYFLSSSGNPKEFIQRRGRVLRKFQGKSIALIYDAICVPPKYLWKQRVVEDVEPSVMSAIRHELRRVFEFSRLAINGRASLEMIGDLKPFFNEVDDEKAGEN